MSNPYYGFSDDISRMCVALERIADSLEILARDKKNSYKEQLEADAERARQLRVDVEHSRQLLSKLSRI